MSFWTDLEPARPGDRHGIRIRARVCIRAAADIGKLNALSLSNRHTDRQCRQEESPAIVLADSVDRGLPVPGISGAQCCPVSRLVEGAYQVGLQRVERILFKRRATIEFIVVAVQKRRPC